MGAALVVSGCFPALRARSHDESTALHLIYRHVTAAPVHVSRAISHACITFREHASPPLGYCAVRGTRTPSLRVERVQEMSLTPEIVARRPDGCTRRCGAHRALSRSTRLEGPGRARTPHNASGAAPQLAAAGAVGATREPRAAAADASGGLLAVAGASA